MAAFPPLAPQREVAAKLDSAFSLLRQRDRYLVENRVHERTVTHKLAEYLQREFPEWDVDCEYNKNGPDTKTVTIPNESMELEDSPVYPDIIIHKRGDWRHLTKPPHLLVVEARKDRWGIEKLLRDHWKVAAYLSELRYQFGVLIEYRLAENEIRYSADWYARNSVGPNC